MKVTGRMGGTGVECYLFVGFYIYTFLWPICICGCKQVRTGVSPYSPCRRVKPLSISILNKPTEMANRDSRVSTPLSHRQQTEHDVAWNKMAIYYTSHVASKYPTASLVIESECCFAPFHHYIYMYNNSVIFYNNQSKMFTWHKQNSTLGLHVIVIILIIRKEA